MTLTPETLHSKIKEEIDYCESAVLPMNPSYAKTQLNVLDLVDKYVNSQYKDGSLDDFGQPKPFYNIVTLPLEVAGKMTEMDTKDIEIKSWDDNYWSAWVMGKELQFWMKDKYFGTQLNRYSYILPKDWHLIVKKVDDDIQIVPIRNLRFRPDAISLKIVPIIERHFYQEDEFIAEAKKRGWDNWKKVVSAKNDSGVQAKNGQIQIFEAYYPSGYLKEKNNYFIVSQSGYTLAFAKLSSSPYKDMPYKKVDGRTVGKGTVEELFNEQIYLNRMAADKANGLYWTSKRIFQTRDNSIAKNLLGNIDNGEVMTVNQEITPVSMEERNLGFYNYEETKWEENAMKRTFTREPITGGRAPSGTPLGSTILQARLAAGFYKQKKEEIANFVKEILWDWILPEFKKQNRGKHEMQMRNLLGGDDASEKYFQMMLNDKMNKLKATSKYLTSQQWEIRRAINADILKEGKVSIPKGIYENLKYKINIVITGEEIDTASKLTTLQTIFQILGSNPTILQDKRVRKVFYKMMDIAGFNPREIEVEETPTIQGASTDTRAQVGGSIARASSPATAAMLQTQQTV